jgi:hypothetical protein
MSLIAMRVFAICTSAVMTYCGMRYSVTMTKGPLRFAARALIVIGGCTWIYSSLRASAPNPWAPLVLSISYLGWTRRAKLMRTNSPAPLLKLQRLDSKTLQDKGASGNLSRI